MLNVTLGAGKGLFSRVIERPGLALPAAELEGLLEDIRSIARSSVPAADLNYGVFRRGSEQLNRCVITVVYQKADKRPIAFNVLSFMDAELRGQPIEVLHLGLVLVDPSVRSRGLSLTLYGLTCILLFVERQARPLWISNVTQVPAVAGMVGETFSDVFPSPRPRSRRSFDHLLLARQIMSRHRHVFGVGVDADFDETRFVIRNAYTGGSDALKKPFEAAKKHRREAYNMFCRRELDYERGDDLLQIARLDMAATARYVTKVAPPSTGFGLIGLALIMVLRAAVLPVIYWLDDTRPLGTLRPWKT